MFSNVMLNKHGFLSVLLEYPLQGSSHTDVHIAFSQKFSTHQICIVEHQRSFGTISMSFMVFFLSKNTSVFTREKARVGRFVRKQEFVDLCRTLVEVHPDIFGGAQSAAAHSESHSGSWGISPRSAPGLSSRLIHMFIFQMAEIIWPWFGWSPHF